MRRQTSDLIALLLAVVVAAVVLTTTAVLLWLKLTHPEQDTMGAAEAISRLVSVITAALVGYMAGRQAGE